MDVIRERFEVEFDNRPAGHGLISRFDDGSFGFGWERPDGQTVRRYRVRMPEGYATADDRQEAGTHYRDLSVLWALKTMHPHDEMSEVERYAMRAAKRAEGVE